MNNTQQLYEWKKVTCEMAKGETCSWRYTDVNGRLIPILHGQIEWYADKAVVNSRDDVWSTDVKFEQLEYLAPVSLPSNDAEQQANVTLPPGTATTTNLLSTYPIPAETNTLESVGEINTEFRSIISHALLGCEMNVPKENWELVFSECTKYAQKLCSKCRSQQHVDPVKFGQWISENNYEGGYNHEGGNYHWYHETEGVKTTQQLYENYLSSLNNK